MSAIEQMLAEDEKRRRSAIKRLQALRFDGREPWNWHEEMIVDAVLELWVTLTLIVEIQKVREQQRRPWWRRLLGRGQG